MERDLLPDIPDRVDTRRHIANVTESLLNVYSLETITVKMMFSCKVKFRTR